MKKKIIVTGGTGRFGNHLKNTVTKHNLFFPTNLTCFSVSWFNPEHLKLSKQLELINKSYSIAREIYSPEEYLENFTWFLFWLKSYKKIQAYYVQAEIQEQ